MFINGIAFLITTSENIHFGTVEALPNRQVGTIKDRLFAVCRLYQSRGFVISVIRGDEEFEPLRGYFPILDCCGPDDHIGPIERYIRTVKERVRSTYAMLPFKHVPRLIVVHLAKNSVFWLNAIPHPDGVSRVHSPRYLLTGYELTYPQHVRAEFGSYVQTHEEHTNDLRHRTIGAICLGPTGSRDGNHYFLNLRTGARVTRTRWTDLPMPSDVVDRVSDLGQAQGMPTHLAFGDRHGTEIEDSLDDILDEPSVRDDPYFTETDTDSTDALSYDTSDSEEEAPDSDLNSIPEIQEWEEFTPPNQPANAESPNGEESDSRGTTSSSTTIDPVSDSDSYNGDVESETSAGDTVSDDPAQNTGVGEWAQEPAVDFSEPEQNTGVEETYEDPNAGPPQSVHDQPEHPHSGEELTSDEDERADNTPTVHDQFQAAEMAGRNAALDPDAPRPTRARKDARDDAYQYLCAMFSSIDVEMAIKLLMDGPDAVSLLTAQMSAKQGLKHFGRAGAEAIEKELEQLVYRRVMEGQDANSLTRSQKKAALRYLMFLKQKRCGRIKGRGCADGRKQRLYKSKEETSSPAVSVEALFLTCVIDAMEGRHVATCDIPNAFMQTDIDELIHIKLEGPIADLLIRVDPSYAKLASYERGQKVIYAKLSKALYGTLQASLLFWKDLTKYLTDLGFAVNPYDPCVANKTIDGTQCTIAWYVDDLKISHAQSSVVEQIVESLQNRFGKEAPLTVNRGKRHTYLGMDIDYSNAGKVSFAMQKYIDEMIDECPPELLKGSAVTPAANHLFEVDDDAEKLGPGDAVLYHHLVAKALYVCKRARPDIQLAVSFLATRVQSPDVDDFKKLGRCMRYLRGTRDLPLTLECSEIGVIRWWVDASFAVHPNYRSHTGATMSLGKGSVYSSSTKQKINARSSTEAELIGVNDAMAMILWTRHFLEGQGFQVQDNVVFQDNQSTMLLARNGKQSSGKSTRHIEIRYYFVTDNIQRGKLRVEYCPTEEMLGDFFTKPLQGTLFRKFRSLILNLKMSPDARQECVGARTRTGVTSPQSRDESQAAGDASGEGHVRLRTDGEGERSPEASRM